MTASRSRFQSCSSASRRQHYWSHEVGRFQALPSNYARSGSRREGREMLVDQDEASAKALSRTQRTNSHEMTHHRVMAYIRRHFITNLP
jgi:hypothetical protein